MVAVAVAVSGRPILLLGNRKRAFKKNDTEKITPYGSSLFHSYYLRFVVSIFDGWGGYGPLMGVVGMVFSTSQVCCTSGVPGREARCLRPLKTLASLTTILLGLCCKLVKARRIKAQHQLQRILPPLSSLVYIEYATPCPIDRRC